MDGQPTERVPAEPVATPARGKRGQGWVVGACAVALVLLVGAIVFLAARGTNDDDKATSSVSANGPTTTADAADKLLQQGLEAQGAGRLDEARSLYVQVISQDPTNKLAYYNLGVIYQQLNAVNDARTAYRRALQIDAKYQPALFNLAVLETPVNTTEAVSLYQQILAINPNDANVHLNLGLLYKQLGRNAEGDAEINKALQLNPSLSSRVPQR